MVNKWIKKGQSNIILRLSLERFKYLDTFIRKVASLHLPNIGRDILNMQRV